LCFVCALTLLSLVKADNAIGHPIAIVPGIVGTMLHSEAKNIPKDRVPLLCPRNKKEFPIWFNVLFDIDVSCFSHYIRTDYIPENDTWPNTPGVTVTVPKEGTTFAIDILDEETTKVAKYFHDTLVTLKNLGYQDGVNLTACGYDWRLKPTEEWAVKCRGFIEKMVESSGKKAILLSHSMGGPYSYYVLRTAPSGWAEKYIHKYITACPPWMGATAALDATFTGIGHDVPEIINYLFAPLTRFFAGLWYLFPWKEAYKDTPVVKTPSKTYYSDDVPEFLAEKGLSDTELKFKSSRSVFTAFNGYDMMPNVDVITTFPRTRKTRTTLVFNEEPKKQGPEDSWKHPDDYLYGVGDGTVPDFSLTYATDKWMQMYPDRNITYFEVWNTTHSDIITHEPFVKMLIDEAFNDY